MAENTVKSDGKTRILVLGAGVMQGPALRIAAEMGLEAVAADADPSAPCAPFAARFEKVDLKDREGIGALARSLAENGGLGGVMTAGTDFSASVAWAAEKLGLPGIPFETALDASDKERMRRRFREAGVPSPEFIILKVPPDTPPPFSWPAVVKPVDNMGSRGCRRVENLDELKAAVKNALSFSRSGRAVVEEFMDGPEFSVDALVYRGEITICGIADRHILFPPYFIEMGHTMPSNRKPDVVNALLETFVLGVKALGITNGAAKGDIKLTSKGPMIGEIAARLSGGYMSGWTYPYSSGMLPTKGAIEIALGKKPSAVTPLWKMTSAERAFISIPGKVRSISGIETAKIMPCVKDVFLRSAPGLSVRFPENNVTKCGNVISAAKSRQEAIDTAENAARSILIRLEAPNGATDAFLAFPPSGENVFPPDAFRVDERVLAAFAFLPATKREKSGGGNPVIAPFPAFTEDDFRDFAGRTVKESLDAVRTLTGMELPVSANYKTAESFVGVSFWKALIRGGYQGAVYYIDSLYAG